MLPVVLLEHQLAAAGDEEGVHVLVLPFRDTGRQTEDLLGIDVVLDHLRYGPAIPQVVGDRRGGELDVGRTVAAGEAGE